MKIIINISTILVMKIIYSIFYCSLKYCLFENNYKKSFYNSLLYQYLKPIATTYISTESCLEDFGLKCFTTEKLFFSLSNKLFSVPP